MDKYAIFLDFDGTLSYGKNLVSKENIDAIKKVQEMGHYVFICTGRHHKGIEPDASVLHNFDGYISGLGSHITIGDEVVYSKYFDNNDVIRVLKKLEDKNRIFTVGCVEATFAINPPETGYDWCIKVPTVEEFAKLSKDYHIQKVDSGEKNWTSEELDLLKSISTAFVHDSYTECCPVGCSKSGGIKIVVDKLEIKSENTIAMGDSANDIDMLKAAGVGVVMGNAPDFVKEYADFVSKSCMDHGVAYALEELIINNK